MGDADVYCGAEASLSFTPTALVHIQTWYLVSVERGHFLIVCGNSKPGPVVRISQECSGMVTGFSCNALLSTAEH